jgi:hypothetical protein
VPHTTPISFFLILSPESTDHEAPHYAISSTPLSPRPSLRGKALPLQAWSGPEGSRKLRFPDFMTTAQDGGKVVSLTHRSPLPLGNTPGTHLC